MADYKFANKAAENRTMDKLFVEFSQYRQKQSKREMIWSALVLPFAGVTLLPGTAFVLIGILGMVFCIRQAAVHRGRFLGEKDTEDMIVKSVSTAIDRGDFTKVDSLANK